MSETGVIRGTAKLSKTGSIEGIWNQNLDNIKDWKWSTASSLIDGNRPPYSVAWYQIVFP